MSGPPWDPNNAPEGISVESATLGAAGSQLTVAFTGAPDPGSKPCGEDYTGEAIETDLAIVVIVTEHHDLRLPGACSAVGSRRTATVILAAPLGNRAVLEIKEGLPVPVLPG